MAYGPDTAQMRQRLTMCMEEGRELDVSDLNITALPSLPEGLVELDCSYTDLTFLPPLPASLRNLYCSAMPNLTELPPLPDGLQILECESCISLHELPPLPSDLRHLDLEFCIHISVLPSLPPHLIMLDIGETDIKVLPSLPLHLKEISIEDTDITELPPLPQSLVKLYTVGAELALPRGDGESIANYNTRWDEWREIRRRKQVAAATAAAVRNYIAGSELFRRRVWALVRRNLRRTLGREPTQAEMDEYPATFPLLEESAFEFDFCTVTAVAHSGSRR